MIIRTYKELKEYIEMFKKQNCDLLIIMSRGGLGKTSLLKSTMKDTDYVYINTHSTPLGTYLTLFEKRDCPVVFDDIDDLLKNRTMVSLLKSLTDTSEIKEIHYNSTSKLLGNAPEHFTTSSNVCILLNEFNVNSPILQPLIDRGFYIEFLPTKEEIIKYIEDILKSQSLTISEKCVLDFIKENKDKIKDLSLRTFIKGLQLYRNDPNNWKEKFTKMIGFDEKTIEYIKLKEKYKTDEERIKNFRWSRATYFRVKKEYEEG